MKKVYSFLIMVLLPFILIANNLDKNFVSTLNVAGGRSIITADFRSTVLSIEENVETHNIKVYPNPVSQQLNIILEIGNHQPSVNLQLKLIDIKGSVIISKEYASNQNNINFGVSGLTTGEYNLLIIIEDMRFTQKVIKK